METADISQVDDDDDDGIGAQLEAHWNAIHGTAPQMPALAQHGNEDVSPSQPESLYGGPTILPPGTTLAPRVNTTTGELYGDNTTMISSDDSGNSSSEKSEDTMYGGKSDIPKPPNRILEGTHPQQLSFDAADDDDDNEQVMEQFQSETEGLTRLHQSGMSYEEALQTWRLYEATYADIPEEEESDPEINEHNASQALSDALKSTSSDNTAEERPDKAVEDEHFTELETGLTKEPNITTGTDGPPTTVDIPESSADLTPADGWDDDELSLSLKESEANDTALVPQSIKPMPTIAELPALPAATPAPAPLPIAPAATPAPAPQPIVPAPVSMPAATLTQRPNARTTTKKQNDTPDLYTIIKYYATCISNQQCG